MELIGSSVRQEYIDRNLRDPTVGLVFFECPVNDPNRSRFSILMKIQNPTSEPLITGLPIFLSKLLTREVSLHAVNINICDGSQSVFRDTVPTNQVTRLIRAVESCDACSGGKDPCKIREVLENTLG